MDIPCVTNHVRLEKYHVWQHVYTDEFRDMAYELYSLCCKVCILLCISVCLPAKMYDIAWYPQWYYVCMCVGMYMIFHVCDNDNVAMYAYRSAVCRLCGCMIFTRIIRMLYVNTHKLIQRGIAICMP